MLRKNLYALVALFLFAPLCAHAQSAVDEHKFEVGGQYTAIGLDDFEPISGVGGRVGYNFHKNFALDAEANYFPQSRLGNDQLGAKTQAFIGLKAGGRMKYAGLFAKARPGVMGIGEITSGFDCNSTSFGSVCRPRHTHFALDAGGVVEFYPTRRSIIRFDVGDTMVNIRRTTRNLLGEPVQTSNDFTHNLQIGLGFGYRF